MHPNASTRPPGHAALRHGRRSLSGQTCLITTTTASRRPWFARWPIAATIARELGSDRLWRDSHVNAWVLMPDHMHILLTLGASESLPHLMRRIKSVTSRQTRRAAPCSQPLGADAYHDRATPRDEDIDRAANHCGPTHTTTAPFVAMKILPAPPATSSPTPCALASSKPHGPGPSGTANGLPATCRRGGSPDRQRRKTPFIPARPTHRGFR